MFSNHEKQRKKKKKIKNKKKRIDIIRIPSIVRGDF